MIGLKDQCFGVEVELTGITREQAAKSLASYFDTSAVHYGGGYDTWTVKDTEGKEWKLMSDSSIRTERKQGDHYVPVSDSFYRVEMVSPKLTYEELPKFQECVRQVRHAGGKVNDSCGLHVHVDASNHNRQSLKNLISIMYSKEDILFKALQVNESRAQRWCQKVRKPMLKKARKLSSTPTKNLTQLEEIWYEGDVSSTEHYNWTRYYALNLHSVFYRGTIEWRCFNSTLHAGRAAAYINLCLAMSAQAISQRCSVMRKTRSDADGTQITPECEKSLDRYEGWPHLYRKEQVQVFDERGQRIPVMVYVMNDKYRSPSIPSASYYHGIRDGFVQNKLPLKYLEQALGHVHGEVFQQSRAHRPKKFGREAR